MRSDLFNALKEALNKPIAVKEILNTPIHLSMGNATPVSNLERVRVKKRRGCSSDAGSSPTCELQVGLIEAGNRTPFAVNGVDFTIGADSWVFGDVKTGRTAKVKLAYSGTDTPFAVSIRIQS